jgi:hypothetical protein
MQTSASYPSGLAVTAREVPGYFDTCPYEPLLTNTLLGLALVHVLRSQFGALQATTR